MDFNTANKSFYEEFIHLLSNNKEEDDNKFEELCMITNENLTEYSVKLSCNHTFNYIPLFNSMVAYFKSLHTFNIFKNNSIVCPYCRTVTNGILQYVPELNVKMIGINKPKQRVYGNNKCDYIDKSGKLCDRKCYYKKCSLHLKKRKNTDSSISKQKSKYQCKAFTIKGSKCKKSSTIEGGLCKIHNKINNNISS